MFTFCHDRLTCTTFPEKTQCAIAGELFSEQLYYGILCGTGSTLVTTDQNDSPLKDLQLLNIEFRLYLSSNQDDLKTNKIM